MIYYTLSRNGEILTGAVLDTWSDYFNATFAPYSYKGVTVFVTDFSISGKTYTERKENARNLLIDVCSDFAPDLSYYEIAEIYAKIEIIAKRYGLLTECRENGII